jgi:hypothetical protein
MTFTPTDRATWPEVLTLAEAAAILRKSPRTLRRACGQRICVPAPAFTAPYRWRRSDITRFIDGPRAVRRAA